MTKCSAKNYIYLILGLIIALFYLSPAKAASFRLSPAESSIPYNCNQQISIMINTEGKIANAAEIEISYDPNLITIIDSEPDFAGIQIGKGIAFDSFVENSVTAGKIRLTAASYSTPLQGEKMFGVINYKAKSYTASALNFLIKFNGIGHTLDSNIAESSTSRDILSSIENATVHINNSSNCGTDILGPNIVLLSKTKEFVELEISDSGSGVDIDSFRVHINNTGLSLSQIQNEVNGNLNNYTIKLTMPADWDGTGQVTIGDKSGNISVKDISLWNLPATGSTDNSYFISYDILKYIPPSILNFIKTLSNPIFLDFGLLGLIATILEALAASNYLRDIVSGFTTRRMSTGRIVAVITNLLKNKPVKGIQAILKDNKSATLTKTYSNKFGYIYYTNGQNQPSELELEFPYNKSFKIGDVHPNSVSLIDISQIPVKGVGNKLRLLFKGLWNMEISTVVIITLCALLIGLIGFLSTPTLSNLIPLPFGTLLIIISVVVSLL